MIMNNASYERTIENIDRMSINELRGFIRFLEDGDDVDVIDDDFDYDDVMDYSNDVNWHAIASIKLRRMILRSKKGK